MKTFLIEPLHGIRDGVQFGMSREEARAMLAPESAEPFSRGESVDGFFDASVQFSYDENGEVEFIEFARNHGHRVLLEDFDIFAAPAVSVVEFLKQHHQLRSDDSEPGYSFRFPSIELGLWRPVLPEDGSDEGTYFESVGFGRAGYYEGNG